MQFQERIPTGGGSGVDGVVDEDGDDGPGFEWTLPMKRRTRRRRRESF